MLEGEPEASPFISYSGYCVNSPRGEEVGPATLRSSHVWVHTDDSRSLLGAPSSPLLPLIPWESFHSSGCSVCWLYMFFLSPGVPLLPEGPSPWSAQPPPPPGSPF